MLSPNAFDWPGEVVTMAPGAMLLQRGSAITHVYHVDQGRVTLGLLENGGLVHQMGMVEGPFWLNASCAVLGLAPIVDATADTTVRTRRVPLSAFAASLKALPQAALSVLHDLARAHQQQTELAVSRLAKDAEARCAEWLLRHTDPAAQGAPGAQAVMLRQRKRMIAAQLGIAPETLSRVLRHLRERSLISGSGRVLNLLDLNGLRALAGS